jgi:hypothetical protein
MSQPRTKKQVAEPQAVNKRSSHEHLSPWSEIGLRG